MFSFPDLSGHVFTTYKHVFDKTGCWLKYGGEIWKFFNKRKKLYSSSVIKVVHRTAWGTLKQLLNVSEYHIKSYLDRAEVNVICRSRRLTRKLDRGLHNFKSLCTTVAPIVAPTAAHLLCENTKERESLSRRWSGSLNHFFLKLVGLINQVQS